MSGSTTPHYSFNLPTVSGDQNVWGNKLNANWSSLDSILNTITTGTGTYLPLTGGAITGALSVAGALTASSNLFVSGGTYLTGTVSFGYSGATDFQIYRATPNRVLNWASGVNDVYNESNASRFWNVHSGSMSLDGGGNLTISGNGYKPGGGSWIATSDDRTKQHVVPYMVGLDEVCRLIPVQFEYNGQGGTTADGRTHYGLSAQATNEVMPELVHEMPVTGSSLPGQLGTDLGPLTMALVNCVRELANRVDALESERG